MHKTVTRCAIAASALCSIILVSFPSFPSTLGMVSKFQLVDHTLKGDRLSNAPPSIITFLMVFVIQNTQNRDGAAIQAKLDELIRVSAARDSLIGIETLTQEEIEQIRATCTAKEARAVNGVQKESKKKPKAAVNKAMS